MKAQEEIHMTHVQGYGLLCLEVRNWRVKQISEMSFFLGSGANWWKGQQKPCQHSGEAGVLECVRKKKD